MLACRDEECSVSRIDLVSSLEEQFVWHLVIHVDDELLVVVRMLWFRINHQMRGWRGRRRRRRRR